MSDEDIPHGSIVIAKEQDWTLRYRILAPEKVRLTSDAGAAATLLIVAPLEHALANGDKLLFDANTVVTLSASASPGQTNLSVNVIPGLLRTGEVGQKIRDLTSFEMALEVLAHAGDAEALITKSGAAVTIMTQSGDNRGLVEVAGLAADTQDIEPGHYFAAFWRRNSGSTRPLATADFEVRAMGFL